MVKSKRIIVTHIFRFYQVHDSRATVISGTNKMLALKPVQTH